VVWKNARLRVECPLSGSKYVFLGLILITWVFLCDVFLLIHTIYLFHLCITVIFCCYSRLAGSFREEPLLEQCLQH